MTLTRWFRLHQRYMIAGLVMLLMASWGVLSTVRTLVNRQRAPREIAGRAVQQADLQDAQRALNMMLRLGLLDSRTAYAMLLRGAPLRASTKMQALSGDFRNFVLPGQEQMPTYDSAWRYLILLYEAQDAGVQVSDGEVTELLRALPQFSDQKGFRRDVYAAVLAQLGLSDADMYRWFVQMCKIAELNTLHSNAVLVSNAELWMAYVYSTESVSIDYVKLDPSLFRPLEQVTDEDLHGFYQAHKDVLPADSPDGIGYKAPERVRAEYALVPIDQIAKQVKVTDAEIAAYYEAHKGDYRLPEKPTPETKGKQPAGKQTPTAKKKAAEPKYKPLSQVRDDIRQKLVDSQAKDQAQKTADSIMSDLQAVRDNYENMPQPLEQIARRHGAEFVTVKTAAGRDLVSSDELASLVPGGPQAAQFAFQTRANLYFPKRFNSTQGPVIFQALEYRDPEVQPYSEVAAQVRADCLQHRAVESARTFGEKLKDAAAKSGLQVAALEMTKRLDNLVKTPAGGKPPALTVGLSPAFTRLSGMVSGVEGETQTDLIRTAFGLRDRQAAVVSTGTPAAYVYVIQLSRRTPASAEGFAGMDPRMRMFYESQKERREVAAWMDGLLKEWPSAAPSKGKG